MDVINKNLASRKQQQQQSAETALYEESCAKNKKTMYTREKKVLVDILLDLYERGEIDIAGIREEVDTFVFAGHDTTSSAVSWTLYEIGRHPDIQMKLHEEIDNVAEAGEKRIVDKIRSLKYLECVIKESLRLHPPVPAFDRMLEADLEVVCGCTIPAGTVVEVDVVNVHRNPKYWPDPHVFDPDRFEKEKSATRSPYCFLPFSAGSRNCIGQKFAMQELKVFLYTILKNFNIKSVQKPDEIETDFGLTITSFNGIHVEFRER